ESLLPFLRPGDDIHPHVRVNAVRALGQLGQARAVAPLVRLLTEMREPDGLTLEVVAALGELGDRAAEEALVDRIAAPWPPLRAAVLRALARVDTMTFTTVLSALDPDRDWRVRAALADAVTALPLEVAGPTLTRLLEDSDQRVLPAVLRAMAKAKMPGLEREVVQRLSSDD